MPDPCQGMFIVPFSGMFYGCDDCALVGWLTQWFALAVGTIMMIFCACSLMYSYYDPRDSVYTVCRTIECSVWLGKSVAE